MNTVETCMHNKCTLTSGICGNHTLFPTTASQLSLLPAGHETELLR